MTLAERQSILSRALIHTPCHLSFKTPSMSGPFLSSMSQHYRTSMSSSSSRHILNQSAATSTNSAHMSCLVAVVPSIIVTQYYRSLTSIIASTMKRVWRRRGSPGSFSCAYTPPTPPHETICYWVHRKEHLVAHPRIDEELEIHNN